MPSVDQFLKYIVTGISPSEITKDSVIVPFLLPPDFIRMTTHCKLWLALQNLNKRAFIFFQTEQCPKPTWQPIPITTTNCNSNHTFTPVWCVACLFFSKLGTLHIHIHFLPCKFLLLNRIVLLMLECLQLQN